MQDTSVNDTASRVNAIIERIGRKPSMLVPVLQAAQEEFKYLPHDVMALIAEGLGVSAAKVYGVATFYAHFTLEPKGKHVIRCCDGTACHVRGSIPILERLRQELGLTDGKKTTDDLNFTVETVSCLGACGLAPAMTVNGTVYGAMTPDKASELLKELKADLEKGGEQA